MTTLSTPADALPLLSCKIAPRQFDLSYRFSSISLRDQIVRAQTLIRTLVEQGLVACHLPEVCAEFELLIVGGGAAGLAAAHEASMHGVSFVLIEQGDDVPGGVLRSSAKRYVSTAMYEWPHPNHAEHDFPLAKPHLLGRNKASATLRLNFKKPVTVGDFGKRLLRELQPSLKRWKSNYTSFCLSKRLSSRELVITGARLSDAAKTLLLDTLKGRVSIHGIPLDEVTLPKITLENSSKSSLGCFKFQYIIYAVGFGVETKSYSSRSVSPYAGYDHRPFWEADLIPAKNLGFSQAPRIGILGSGDGALQDALRCLVDPKCPHPLAIWNGILECPQNGLPRLKYSRHVDKALARIAAADMYTTAGAVWSPQPHIFESLDEAFIEIASDLIAKEGGSCKQQLARCFVMMCRELPSSPETATSQRRMRSTAFLRISSMVH
ncbi:NAD(P)-binding protein [Comamonas sp. 26]|uniref:NAD(P)-binding protein n=1 Tax=Comamonas sp. 26 TaxID=2035201 RepID=UPI000C17A5F3|nr:NAD(P)-binding protein [Comamonas sp. 26]PIG00360.1 putative NAD(P)-binding protein [Comamonas sp. 26]